MPHNAQEQVGHRRILSGEGERLFDKLHLHAMLRECQNDPAKVIEVAREPVHALTDKGVALTDERERRFELWPLGILAAGVI